MGGGCRGSATLGHFAPGLMGMDMRVGRCHMEVHQRLTAGQVANHPFVLFQMPPEAAGGAAPEEVAEAADEGDSAEAFAAEAAAGEVAEAAAPDRSTLPWRQGRSRRRS